MSTQTRTRRRGRMRKRNLVVAGKRSKVRYIDAVPAEKKHRYTPVEGRVEDVSAWDPTPMWWTCDNPAHPPFHTSPRAIVVSRRKRPTENCPACRAFSFADTYPEWVPYLRVNPSTVVTKDTLGPLPWECPQCGFHFEATMAKLRRLDNSNWADPQRNQRTRTARDMVVSGCRICSGTLATIPQLATYFVKSGLDGVTDPAQVDLHNHTMTVLRNKNTIWSCADCGAHHTRTINYTLVGWRETQRLPKCRGCV